MHTNFTWQITNTLSKVYSKKDTLEIIESLEKQNIKSNKINTFDKNWYKKLNIYVTYPDSFKQNKRANLKTLSNKIPYLKNLGINAIHILPFLDSPMIDLGFDVSNYKKVRQDLGTKKDFLELLNKSKEHNIEIFMDLVFNHVSDTHKWFKKATGGNKKYRDYFLCFKEKPLLINIEQRSNGSFAIYKTHKGNVACRIIFPDFTGDVPHFFKAKDNYWYYHTFYKNQPDLNWYNKNVFIEFSKILTYWSSIGLNFRLDAVTFMAKDFENGKIESNKNLHYIIQALNLITKQASPKSVFLVETAQQINTIKKYFGSSTIESELAYNFNLMNALWSAVLNKNSLHIWNSLSKSFTNIPTHAYWVTFIRNHDELTLEFASARQRQIIHKKLSNRGLSFRQGYGVAGRTKSLLEDNNQRLLISYFLLASLPGNPAIIYGDELGKINDTEYIDNQQKYKQMILGIKNAKKDARDVNRGYVTENNIQEGKILYNQFASIFKARRKYSEFFVKPPAKNTDNINKNLFYGNYIYKSKILTACVNLSKTKTHIVKCSLPINLVNECGKIEIQEEFIKVKPLSGFWAIKKQPKE